MKKKIIFGASVLIIITCFFVLLSMKEPKKEEPVQTPLTYEGSKVPDQISFEDYKNIDELMVDAKEIDYRDGNIFHPYILTDNQYLIGYITDPPKNENDILNTSYQEIVYLDLKTNDYTTIRRIDNPKENENIFFLGANKNYFVYALSKGNSEIYLYDFFTGKERQLTSLSEFTKFDSSWTFYNDKIIFSAYHEQNAVFQTIVYSIKEDKIEFIEEGNSNNAVICNDKLYYLTADGTTHITKLIEYNFEDQSKTTLVEKQGQMDFIYQLFTTGNDLLFVICSPTRFTLYQVDFETRTWYQVFYILNGNFIGLKNNYMYFNGAIAMNGPASMLSALYDFKNNVAYTTNGHCVLSNKGMVYFERKSGEIPKGYSLTREYSTMKYITFNETE